MRRLADAREPHRSLLEGVRHGDKRLTATLQPTLERLSEQEKLALTYAALLPADQIALPWIRSLVAEQFSELGRDAEPGHPDPWRNVLRRLFSLRLLQATGVADQNGQPLVGRMHRLLQDLVQRADWTRYGFWRRLVYGLLEKLLRRGIFEVVLNRYVRLRAEFLWEGWVQHEHRWELKPLAACAWLWMERGNPVGTYLANQAYGPLLHLGYFRDAEALIRRAMAITEQRFGPNHHQTATNLDNLSQLLTKTNRLTHHHKKPCENSEDATGLSRWTFTMPVTTIACDARDATGLSRWRFTLAASSWHSYSAV